MFLGVIFIFILGVVGVGGENQVFFYMQMVFGYILGYVVIVQVFLLLYYKKNLIFIYGYLEEWLGLEVYKIGVVYFLFFCIIGVVFWFYFVVIVLQAFVLGFFGVFFFVIVVVMIVLIWVYIFKGGINIIVWIDIL